MALQARVGGSFAPPLTDELLARDRKLAEDLDDGPVREAMLSLLACCEKWWELPESDSVGEPHESGVGVKIALHPQAVSDLEKLIPWKEELEMFGKLFETIPISLSDLRNGAFHLLWHVVELYLGREPMTSDKL